jgi:hypothetical protein
MTHISNSAANARETARQRTGQFGEQEHSAPEATLHLGGTPLVSADGPDRPVVYLYDDTASEYVPTTLAGARAHLRIPDDESDDVVRDTVALLNKGDGLTPYVLDEPSYTDPDEDAVMPTEGWVEPDDDVTWNEHADTWRDTFDGKLTVIASAKFDPVNYGYAGHREAFMSLMAAQNPDGRDIHDDDTHVYLPVEQKFTDDEYTPAIVRRRMHDAFWEANPHELLTNVKQTGILISDKDLIASRGIAGRPVAYAAAAGGKTPSDAEMVAICRELAPTATLSHGYIAPGDEALVGFEEKHRPTLTAALNAWLTNRKKA